MIKLFFILTAVCLIGGGYYFIDDYANKSHEEVHKDISVLYGCKNYTIGYDHPTKGGYFVCNKKADWYNENHHREEILLHSLNEIVSYNVKVIYLSIFFIGLVVTFFTLIVWSDD